MEVSYDDGVPYAEGLPVIKVTKFAPPSGKGAYRFDTEPFPVEPGKSYRFSIWLRADAPISVAFTFDGGSSKLHRLLGKDYRHWWHRPKRQAALDEQWREYALVTRVPGPGDAYYIAGMREVRITISSANGTYWAANAKVVELGNSAADASKPPEGEGQTPGMEYTYVPKDKVGDLTVFLDDLRLLRASWKGINLFHKWGELYSPISWGFRKGRSHKGRTVYQPDDLDDVIWVYLVNDVPVRVQRSKRRVEYLWGTSYCLSEFSANDVRSRTIPAVGACSHLQSDVRQLNRLVMTGNRITVTTTLKFLDRPKNKVIFYPVIFPGTGRNRKYLPELRVLAQPCNVIDRHGRTYTQILPRERKAAVWLDSEPRSLLWDLEGVGRIRYDFRFSDPSVSLLFYAHTGWPTPSLNPYVCPAIVGKIAIPAQDGLKDGAYACTMQMAVTVGDAAEHGPERDGPPKPLPLDDHFDLRVAAPRPSYRFLADDAIELTVVVDGFRTGRPRDLTLDARVLDYENQQAHRQQLGLSLPRDIDRPLKLRLPSLGTGAFVLDVQLLEGDRVVGAKAQRFCVVDKPVPHPAAKSFFGCANGFVRFPGADLNDIRETLSLAVDLGIKKLRWNENYTVDWKKAEPTPGNYVFPTEFPKLEIARSLGMSNFLSFASFEGARATPEWAKSGRKTLYSYDVPKDLQAYEDYCYQVAARFKGLIREFELENEPNYVRPENDREMQDYLADKAQILAAAYRGIKRAQPGAIVIGGTIGVTGLKALKWLDRLLEHAQRKRWRRYDVTGPHCR
nr:hypothetical protein [PVC group bacterium]